MKRLIISAIIIAAVAFVSPGAAYAHHPEITGHTECYTGDTWEVVWTVAPDADRDHLDWWIDGDGYTPAGIQTATTANTFTRTATYPTTQDAATETVTAEWSNGVRSTRTGTVERPEPCPAPTTTTTTTTVAPTTTTTTVAPTTTTTQPPTTTTAPTTTAPTTVPPVTTVPPPVTEPSTVPPVTTIQPTPQPVDPVPVTTTQPDPLEAELLPPTGAGFTFGLALIGMFLLLAGIGLSALSGDDQ